MLCGEGLGLEFPPLAFIERCMSGSFLLQPELDSLLIVNKGDLFSIYALNSLQVHHLNLALLVWLWWRVDLAPPVRPIAAVLLACCVYRPLLPQVLTLLLGSQPAGFTLLAANATTTLCTALIASHMFITHTCS